MSAAATNESEMVLMVMLPEDDRVMLVQTPCMRTVGDLENFIVDEYARLFPHLPALNRDLRIQKCMSPELVVNRRAQAKMRHEAPHTFVDLAKNVQAGNVFQNMEQIYVVTNPKYKMQKQEESVPSVVKAHSVQEKSGVGIKKMKKGDAVAAHDMQASAEQNALKKAVLTRKVQAKGGVASKLKSKKESVVAHSVQTENGNESNLKQQDPRNGAVEVNNLQAKVEPKQRQTKKGSAVAQSRKAGAEKNHKQKSKMVAAEDQHVETEPDNVSNEATEEEDQNGKIALEKGKRVKKSHPKEKSQESKESPDNCTEGIAKEATAKERSDAKKAAGKKSGEKKVEKATKATTKDKDDAKKTAKKETDDLKKEMKKKNNSDAKKSEVETDQITSNKALKKSAPKKSENALLKKMLAAKQNASDSGAALMMNSLRNKESDVSEAYSKSDRTRKASENDVVAERNGASSLLPPTKKKKTTKLESKPIIISDSESKPADEEVVSAEKKSTKKKDNTQKLTKGKGTVAMIDISPISSDDGSSTASEITHISRKVKKKMDTKSDDVEEPVLKRAKAEASPKAKKTSEKTMSSAKLATPETELSSNQSSSSSGSSTRDKEAPSGEELEEVEISAVKVKPSKKTEKTGENESFRKILADKAKGLADGKKNKDAKPVRSVKHEKKSKQRSKSAEIMANESTSDCDQHVLAPKQSSTNSTPGESSSTSSSDEDGQDYSQCLLADLNKNDTYQEVVSVTPKHERKLKQIHPRDDSSAKNSDDSEQSHATSQESNSVLMPSLSRNSFSLGSIPVAKLKKSSKNPFA